jgi:hypothetical protein
MSTPGWSLYAVTQVTMSFIELALYVASVT